MEGFQVLVRGRLVTAQAHFAKVAHYADGGAAVELEAGAAVIDVQATFKPEACLQTVPQVFHATKAQAAAGVAAVGQAGHALAGGGDAGYGNVGHAEKGHVRALGRSACGGGQCGQGKKGSFHGVQLWLCEWEKPEGCVHYTNHL